VISQRPAPDEAVEPGATVELVVSTGPPPVAVPDVVGQRAADAEALLGDAGLLVRRSLVPVEDPAQDRAVIDQRPGGGEEVDEGARVRIFVGRGPVTPGPDGPADGEPGARGPAARPDRPGRGNRVNQGRFVDDG